MDVLALVVHQIVIVVECVNIVIQPLISVLLAGVWVVFCTVMRLEIVWAQLNAKGIQEFMKCKDKKFLIYVGIIFYFCILFAIDSEAVEFRDGIWRIKVVRVVDKTLPMVSEKDIDIALKTARELGILKFETNIKFIDTKRSISVKEFFEKNRKLALKEFERLEKLNFNIFDEKIRYKEFHLKSLKEMDINIIRSFFPDEISKNIFTYEDALKFLTEQYIEIKKEIKKIKSDSKSPYFKNKNQFYYWSSYWLTALNVEKDYDLIITNLPIVSGENLSILHGVPIGVVHGLSLMREFYYTNKPVVVSTFPIYAEINFLKEVKGELSGEEKAEVLGEFILHELGHSLFHLPDNYQPENIGCVMHRNYVTLNDKVRYRLIRERRAPCKYEVDMKELAEAVKWWRLGDKIKANEIFDKLEEKFKNDFYFLWMIGSAYLAMGEEKKEDLIRVYKNTLRLANTDKKKEMAKFLLEGIEE
jgi:hypothetical protein